MAIIGNFLKTAIKFIGSVAPPEVDDPAEKQRILLLDMLDRAKNTGFGRKYRFAELLEAEDPLRAFQEKVPYFDYHRLYDEFWYRLLDNERNVTWPGETHYFARSSGTTGSDSKHIPITEDMLAAFRKTGVQQLLATKNFDLPADFFEREILMLGSSTALTDRGDYREGEISGITANHIPSWFDGFYRPGPEIAKIPDWDERVLAIAKAAPDWDIGALSGIPSWMELMLRKVIAYHKLETIHDIWPNLRVYTSGGVAFAPYRARFDALTREPLTVIDTYLASEGFLAFNTRPETSAMQLALDNGIFFEFVPMSPDNLLADGTVSPDARALTIDKVEADTDYILLISTVSGAWRYMIGDTIAFTDLKRSEIKITGRTKFFLNVVGSQLSVDKLDAAVTHLAESQGIDISEYVVAAVQNEAEAWGHKWYLGTDDELDPEVAADTLDTHLRELNHNYDVARSKALEHLWVVPVPAAAFPAYLAQRKKKGGQVKMPRVMQADQFSTWESFAAEFDPKEISS